MSILHPLEPSDRFNEHSCLGHRRVAGSDARNSYMSNPAHKEKILLLDPVRSTHPDLQWGISRIYESGEESRLFR